LSTRSRFPTIDLVAAPKRESHDPRIFGLSFSLSPTSHRFAITSQTSHDPGHRQAWTRPELVAQAQLALLVQRQRQRRARGEAAM
jgi:hypothetical protein